MSIIPRIKAIFPEMTTDFFKRLEKIGEPRFMIAGDIDHWFDLRGQINAITGRVNSYRDIRRITEAEGRTVPSLGTLRNYLGEGGVARRDIAVADWRRWFEDFGHITEYFEEELEYLSTHEQWEEFREVYSLFLGYQ